MHINMTPHGTLSLEDYALFQRLHAFIDASANYFAKQIGIPDNVSAHIEFFDNTKDYMLHGISVIPAEISAGGAVLFKAPYFDTRTVTDFDILIARGMTPGMTLVTLAHELVHVNQYLTHKLVTTSFFGIGYNAWEGKIVSSDVAYEDLPWEIEAIQMSNDLTNRLAADAESINKLVEIFK